MFKERQITARLLEDGSVEVVDPGYESLEFLKTINPSFEIQRGPLPGFTEPKLTSAMKTTVAAGRKELPHLPTERLWKIHDVALAVQAGSLVSGIGQKDDASLIELKAELARREIAACMLCGRRCGVDRLSGATGSCGLGDTALVSEMFVHICEEPPVNPSLNINLRGCGLQCCYCQKPDWLEPQGAGMPLDGRMNKALYDIVHTSRSVMFIGGNPDESLYAVLHFLSHLPKPITKPLVWKNNGYASPQVYRLLNGIIDVYIPDAKFYSPICSEELADCANYFEDFRRGIKALLEQEAFVIVRILVLPGHSICCHKPMIDFLAKYQERIKLNIMSQYFPSHHMSKNGQSPMNTRLVTDEFLKVWNYAAHYGSDWLNLPKEL